MNIPSPVLADWVRDGLGKRLLMDVRDPADFADGHIPGARNIRLQDVEATRKSPDFSGYSSIVVYGRDGGSARSTAMVKRLLNLGYKDVRALDEGYAGWLSVGGSVERGR